MSRHVQKTPWWKDPLVHFVAFGTAVFAAHWYLAPVQPGNAIILSEPMVRGLQQEHARRTGAAPTAAEADALIDQYVRNEILYREALAQGLDRGDIIVRRRLVQKMEFLLENQESISEPSDAELEAFLDAHAERYTVPDRLSFTHVFVGRDRHADPAAVAGELLARLRTGSDSSGLGDPFLHGTTFTLRTADELTGLFGGEFVAQLGQAELNEWSPPLRSSFGVHLVRVSEVRPERRPALADVRTRVHRDWTDARRVELNERALQQLRHRYEVRVDGAATKVAALQ